MANGHAFLLAMGFARLPTPGFQKAFASARPVRHPLMQLRAFARGDGHETCRAAFVVPKKMGKATLRNRVRRRMRAALQHLEREGDLAEYSAGRDFIFIAAPEAVDAAFPELCEAMHQLLRRATRG